MGSRRLEKPRRGVVDPGAWVGEMANGHVSMGVRKSE